MNKANKILWKSGKLLASMTKSKRKNTKASNFWSEMMFIITDPIVIRVLNEKHEKNLSHKCNNLEK